MRGFLVVIAPALASAALAVQSPPPQSPPVVFRSGTDLVRFDVGVTDAQGRPITDLRADEIQIVEDGAPRPILLFQHLEEPAASYAQASLRAVSAEVSSNRGAPRGHLYLLVFDQRHIAAGNEQVARRAAESFIRTHVRPSDRVAVFGIPGPGPQVGFTADRTRAIAELTKVRGSLERTVDSPAGRLSVQEAYEVVNGNDAVVASILTRQSADVTADVGASPAAMNGTPVDRASAKAPEDPSVVRRVILENARTVVSREDEASRDSLLRLADLIERYRSVEGRKTVLFFSEGFHQQNVTRELERVAAAAAESYAVFYAFDLNRRASQLDQASVQATSEGVEIQQMTEPLGNLAVETDGVLINDAASHLDAALTQVARQTQDYYLVGFSPSAAAVSAPGAYRRVSVRVTRPGARVSARTGYAVPHAGVTPRRDAIDAALAAPFAQQGLRVDYATYQMRGDNAGRSRVILSLEAELPLRNGPNGAADVVFVVRDLRDGRVAASGTDTVALPSAADGRGSTGVGRYRVHFDVPPGTYLMRTVVREPGGLLGSADRKLEVRGFSGPDVSVGDLIVDSPASPLPVRARAYAQDGLSAVLETYARSAAQLNALAVTATLVSADSGAPAATFRADIAAPLETGGALMRRATLMAPLADVAPGSYVARVKVTADGETVGELEREVEVVAGSAPAPLPPPMPQLNPRDVLDSDFVKKARATLRAGTTPAAVQATKGLDAFERGDYPAAATALAAAFSDLGDHAAVAFVLGWAYEGAGDHRSALGSWRAATTIDPKFLPAHLALAEGYVRISERALAVQALKAGLAALPDSPELRTRLAQLQGQ